MTRQRRDEWLVEIDLNTAGVLDEDEENGTTSIHVVSVVPDSLRRTMIENEVKVGTHQGAMSRIAGLWDSSVPVVAYAEGVRAVPEVGAAPVATAFSNLISAAAQVLPTATKRTVAEVGATTTVVVEDLNDAHAITGLGMVAIGTPPIARMYNYTAATDTITLTQALPGAPALNDPVHGGLVWQCADTWDTLPCPLVLRAIGNDDRQNHRGWGGVASLSVGEIAPNEVAKVEATCLFAEAQNNFAYVAAVPDATTPKVWAGGRVAISKYGATTFVDLCARVQFKMAGSWAKVQCPNVANGVGNWFRGAGADEIILTIPHDVSPVSIIGGAVTDWTQILEAGATDHYQLTVQYGSTAGNIFAGGWPRLVLTDVTQGEIDEADARILTLKPSYLASVKWLALLS